MKSRKTQLRFFDVMDYEKEADYLSDMHSKGWKFTHVNFPGLYHFTKCEPKKVRYQLDYNKDGIAHKDEYTQMFADCGWEYLFDFVGYSYFRKPETDDDMDEEIFCDDDSRMDMIKRIFKGRIIPLIVIFFACILPVLYRATVYGYGPETTTPTVIVVEMIVCLVLYVSIFLRFILKYLTFRRSMGR